MTTKKASVQCACDQCRRSLDERIAAALQYCSQPGTDRRRLFRAIRRVRNLADQLGAGNIHTLWLEALVSHGADNSKTDPLVQLWQALRPYRDDPERRRLLYRELQAIRQRGCQHGRART